MICDECETVAHCSTFGCIPKVAVGGQVVQCHKCGLSKSSGAMGSVLPQCKCDFKQPTKVWDADGYDALVQELELLRADNKKLRAELKGIRSIIKLALN